MKQIFKPIVTFILTLIAKGILWRHKPRVIAITGSVGKTSTKDAIYTVLKDVGSIRRSEKSFNSELGVPLSIIGATSGWNDPLAWLSIVFHGIWQVIGISVSYPKTLVLEVGADRPGDIQKIATWLRPEIAVFTRLPDIPVHIEFFPTLDSLIKEKLSLAESLRKEGMLVLNADDSRIMEAKSKLPFKSVTYGFSEYADIQASNVQFIAPSEGSLGGISFKVNYDGKSFPVFLPEIFSRTYVSVGLAALATAYAYGANMVGAIQSLSQYRTPPGRARIIPGIAGSVLIDDTYNSSPAACEAGLSMLGELPFGTRKIAVLGDMLELGKYTTEAHKAIGALSKKNADILIAVGLRAKEFVEGAREARMGVKRVFEADTADTASDILKELVVPGDVVFIKGSQGMRMENTVKALMLYPEDASKLLVRQEKEWRR